jgi:ketosteroid isomerase-like protein
MPIRARKLIAAVGALTVAACARTVTTMDESRRSQVAQQVEQQMRSFEAAERALDVEKLLEHFANASDFCMFSDDQRLTFEVMATGVRNTFPTLRAIEGGFSDLHVTVLASDAALVSATFRETVTDRNGNVAAQQGVATWLWRTVGDHWRIAYGHVAHYSREPKK